jgi:hypothetical protein
MNGTQVFMFHLCRLWFYVISLPSMPIRQHILALDKQESKFNPTLFRTGARPICSTHVGLYKQQDTSSFTLFFHLLCSTVCPRSLASCEPPPPPRRPSPRCATTDHQRSILLRQVWVGRWSCYRQEHHYRGSLLQQAAPDGFDPLSIGLSEEHVHVKDQAAPPSTSTWISAAIVYVVRQLLP